VRVLHAQKVSGIGGSERHLLSLLPALAGAGVEVRMCIAATGGASDFIERLRELAIPHSVVRAGPDLNPLLVGSLRRELRAVRPDLVHTHLIHADVHGQLAARLAGIPAVSSIHGTHSFYTREPYRMAARIAGRSARRTIAISQHVRRYIEGLGISRPGTVRTIYYGIDAAGWVATDAERARARAHLDLGDEEIAIGVAARLVPHKGHGFLLDAHAKAVRVIPAMRLLVAGDGPLRSELVSRARALDGTVRFLGFVEEIREFMYACDVVAFPSRPEFGEGFGLAALEAMAAGRPVVATAVASLPEVVGTNGAGMLVDPKSTDELAEALVELARNTALRRELGERAHARARATFSLQAMVERTLAVYGEALGSSSATG
jgi:glycosyltransferase involved in cell wall biosynthesis